jgi:hypothetical protein
MATIVVETGSGSATANSYISEPDFLTYATDRDVTITGTEAVLLIQAMDYIEQQPFKGVKGSDEQALQWPRWGVLIDGYYVDTDEIPVLLQDALCEVAIGIDGGTNPLADEARATKSEKVGEIAVTYMDGARNSTYLKAAETKLQKLLKAGSGGISAVAIRG